MLQDWLQGGTERGEDMDINFRLFSERLRRVFADEEVMLPDAAKLPKSRDMVGLDDRMEELLDLLIEGPP